MRLALIIDDYLPYSTRVGAKMMHELALELQHQGHEPIVITPGASDQCHTVVKDVLDGVTVYRFRSGPLKDIPKLRRAINESLLSMRAWHSLKSIIKSAPIDGVIYYSPSIFFGSLVRKIKRQWKCPSYLILRDLFPQWVIDEGMIREGSPIARYFRYFEEINYAAADHIGLMSQRNVDFFRERHPRFKQIEVLHNWASLQPQATQPDAERGYREQLGLEGKVIYFYGGNIGHAQDMSNLLRLAQSMQLHPEAHFLFVGQGDEVDVVKDFIIRHALKNTTYLPSLPQTEFSQLLTEIDIGLFSLAKTHKSHNFPGKLLGYMKNGIPILGSVNPGNDLLEMINQAGAGFVRVNGEDEALLQYAQLLLEDVSTRLKQGMQARKLLEDKFTTSSATCLLVRRLGSSCK